MSAEPNYRIGPDDTFSPGDLKADADTLSRQIELLDLQTNGRPGLPRDLVDAWVYFQGDWAAFYEDHFTSTLSRWVTAANNANRDQLIQFELRFSLIAARFRAVDVAPAGLDVQPKPPESPGGGLLSGVGFAAVALIVLVIVLAKVVK